MTSLEDIQQKIHDETSRYHRNMDRLKQQKLDAEALLRGDQRQKALADRNNNAKKRIQQQIEASQHTLSDTLMQLKALYEDEI